MKALVTGGGGFLGRYLVEQLVDRGYQVSVLCRGRYPELEAMDIDIIRGSVSDVETVDQAVANQDFVFHVAAKVGYWGSYEDYYHTNVVGTKNLLRACQTSGIKKLIYTSSPSVVMNNIDITNGDESLPYFDHYLSDYSATKAIAERLVLEANQPGKLQTLSIRPHLIVGPRDNHLLPRVVSKAKNGRLRQIGPGKNQVSICYVENAAHAHILAAESDNTGGKAYFINEPEPVTLWPWLCSILQRLGAPEPRIKVPFKVAFSAGWVLEKLYGALNIEQEPMVTRFLAAELYRNHTFSIQRAQQDFDYKPLLSFAEAEEKTLQSFMKSAGN